MTKLRKYCMLLSLCLGAGTHIGVAKADDCNTNGVPDQDDLLEVLQPAGDWASAPSLAFPDLVETTDTISIPASTAFDDVDVDLTVTHIFIGDCQFWLDKGGTSVSLLSSNTTNGNQNCDLLLDDEAAGPAPVDAPLFGTFQPVQPLGVFDSDGDQAGAWTIHCLDTFSGSGTGVLNQWSLHFSRLGVNSADCNTNGTPDECEMSDCDSNGVPDECDGDCNTNGVADACEPSSVVLQEDFNASPGLPAGWTVEQPHPPWLALWHVTNACLQDNHCEGGYWAYFGHDDTCEFESGITTEGILVSPLITIADNAVAATLRYCSAYDGEAEWDQARVFVRRDGYPDWEVDSVDDDNTVEGWEERSVDLAYYGYVGETIRLCWHFYSHDQFNNNYLGWQVDHIRVIAEFADDCNTNDQVDACEQDADCNTDGLVDACSPGEDCNTNARPDVCDPDLYETSVGDHYAVPGLYFPDNEITHTISVESAAECFDVNVRLDVAHPFMGDTIYWLDRNGQSVSLMSGAGASSDDGSVFFDDQSEEFPPSAGPVFGTFKPAESLNVLAGPTGGDWTIHCWDTFSGSGTGRLQEWSLHFLGYRQSLDCDTNGVPDECESQTDCNTNGMADSCDAGGTSPDCNTDGTPDECDLVLQIVTPTGLYDDEPQLPIPEFPEYASAAITVGSLVPFDDLNVGLSATHPLLRDCEFVLERDGVSVGVLFLAGLDYSDVLLDDEAEADLPWDQPLLGTFRPSQPLSAFDVLEDAQGTWSLSFTDYDWGYSGILHSWSLHFSVTNPESSDCNTNEVPDECELPDCNTNGVGDECELGDGTAQDCNTNSTLDLCDVAAATSGDCNTDSAPDECDFAPDCNSNGIPDECDLSPANDWISTPERIFPDNVNTIETIHVAAGGAFDDLNVGLVVTHPFMGDTQYALEREGTTISLMFHKGSETDNADVLLDDEASGPPPTFEDLLGTFQPEQPFSTFEDGGAAAGVWALHCLDTYTGSGTGVLNQWSLHFSGPQYAAIDCNSDGIPDECQDCNTNGTGDGCEMSSAVIDQSSDVYLAAPSHDLSDCGLADDSQKLWDDFAAPSSAILGAGIARFVPGWPGFGSVPFLVEIADVPGGAEAGGTVILSTTGIGRTDGSGIVDFDFAGAVLPPGTWWIAVQATGGACDYGLALWYRSNYETPNGSEHYWHNPGGGLGLGTDPIPYSTLYGDAADLAVTLHVTRDCNANGVLDECDIAQGGSGDCNTNGPPDDCEIGSGDCDTNGVTDLCDPDFADCNGNNIKDACDIAAGTSQDCNANAVSDECENADCNTNGAADVCEAFSGTSEDCDTNGVPDECDGDCNTNGVGDVCDVAAGETDCNTNGVPDVCDAFPWDGYVVQFTNVDSHVQVGAPAELEMEGALTMEAWIFPTGRGDHPVEGGTILCKEGEYGLARFADGYICFALANEWGWSWRPMFVAPEGAWTHVALTYDGSQIRGYKNGQFLYGAGAVFSPIGDALPQYNDFRIGNRQAYARYFEGQIDEVRIWNVGRSYDEIQSSYDQTLTGTEPGLVGYWRFQEGSGTVAGDTAGNDQNGTLVDGAIWSPRDVDCNTNGIPDECDVASGESQDCNTNAAPDACDGDCNTNSLADVCDIASGESQDCNANSEADECESGCNTNGVPDECDGDCNTNGLADVCDIDAGSSGDCDTDGEPDECDVGLIVTTNSHYSVPYLTFPDLVETTDSIVLSDSAPFSDLNVELIVVHDWIGETQYWLDHNGTTAYLMKNEGYESDDAWIIFDDEADGPVPWYGPYFGEAYRPLTPLGVFDSQPDQSGTWTLHCLDTEADGLTGLLVSWSLHFSHTASGESPDCDSNGAPDDCDPDCDTNGIPDACDVDCNTNGHADACDIAAGSSSECNTDGVPDECEAATLTAYTSPANIPFPDLVETTDAITITDSAPFTDLNVELFALHDFFMGDTQFWLDRDGTTAFLMMNQGLTQEAAHVLLDDEAAGPPAFPLVGTFQPATPLSVFDQDSDQAGTWTIHCLDTYPGDGTGLLYSWSLHFSFTTSGPSVDCNSNSEPDECEPDCDTNGVPDSCESDCNTDGVHDLCEIDDGEAEDCNTNAAPDECDLDVQTMQSAYEQVPILEFPDLIEVTDSITLAGSAPFSDVNVGLQALHQHMGDTQYWIDRGGTTVNLMMNVGQSGASVNASILFDDEASDPPPYYYPLFGTFTPAQPLSAFDANPDQAGTWTIHCLDTFSGDGTGILYGWSLHFSVIDSASPDCNSNGAPDECDIADGGSADSDGDGIPDECSAVPCPTCPGDANGDGLVDGDDVTAFVECLIGGGACTCTDVDGDGQPANTDPADDVAALVTMLLEQTDPACP